VPEFQKLGLFCALSLPSSSFFRLVLSLTERGGGATPMPELAGWLGFSRGPGGAQPLLRHASPKAACSAPANSCSCGARARARARVALRVPWPSEWNCSVLIEKFKRDFVSG